MLSRVLISDLSYIFNSIKDAIILVGAAGRPQQQHLLNNNNLLNNFVFYTKVKNNRCALLINAKLKVNYFIQYNVFASCYLLVYCLALSTVRKPQAASSE